MLLSTRVAPPRPGGGRRRGAGATSIEQLASQIAAISRFDGLTVQLGRPGVRGGRTLARIDSPQLRLTGRLNLRIRVR